MKHQQKRSVRSRIGLAILGVSMLASCGPTEEGTPVDPSATSETRSVVAVTSLLCDVAGAIADDAIDLTCLMSPGQDPHAYRLKPSDLAAIETADLVLYNGYDLMPGIAATVREKSQPDAAIAVAELAVAEPLEFAGHDAHGHEDHEEHGHDGEHDEHDGHEQGDDEAHDAHAGHDHGEHDPHVWHDAQNGKAIVSIVADRLSDLDPERAADYQANAEALSDRLDLVHDWIGEQVATIPEDSRKLVTAHDAFAYFTHAYGLTQTGALAGLSPADKPSPAELAEIVDRIEDGGVPAIFAETTSSSQLVESVAREAGIVVGDRPLLVDSPDPTIAGAADYPEMLAYNTCAIVEPLGGSCDREALEF